MRSPTALSYTYPLSSPSSRFQRYNDYVRQLDLRYSRLAAADQAGWELAGVYTPWWCWCLWEWFNELPYSALAASGVQAYRAVNCNRLTRGLDILDICPAVGAVPQNDALIVVGAPSYMLSWIHDGTSWGGGFGGDVLLRPLNHEPESGPAASKMSYAGSLSLPDDMPVSFASIASAFPGGQTAPFVAIAVSVTDDRGVPVAVVRGGYAN